MIFKCLPLVNQFLLRSQSKGFIGFNQENLTFKKTA